MTHAFPLPDTDWEPTREFYAAAGRGELRVPRCSGCGAWNWYPPVACRTCQGGELTWTVTSGRGTLFSWAVVRRGLAPKFASLVPYVTGLVSLEEDPAVRIVTLVVDCEPEALRMDLPMRAVFRPLPFEDPAGAVIAPMFTPAV